MATLIRSIGYWHEPPARDGLPDVRNFVDHATDPKVQAEIVAYLRSGTAWVALAGRSLCRICGKANGSTELTDGENFVWPEGLAHYVETHDVRLPNDVAVVAARGPAAPIDAVEFERALFDTGEIRLL
jgi:hypothetical protein